MFRFVTELRVKVLQIKQPIFSLIFFILTSCQPTKPDEKKDFKTNDSLAQETPLLTKDIKFEIEQIDSNIDQPISKIYFLVGPNRLLIESIAGSAGIYDKKDFANKGVPDSAITACGAWWAGAGDYFYATKTDKQYFIYQGWQDEMQDDKGFHWKLIKGNIK